MAATKRARKTAAKKVATEATNGSVECSAQELIRLAIAKIESNEPISGHQYAPMALTGLRKAIVWLDRIEGEVSQ